MTNTESYQDKAAAQLTEIGRQLEQAKAKAGEVGAEASAEAQQAVGALEEQFSAAKKRIAELGDAGEDAWAKATSELDSAWDGLKGGIKKLLG